MADFDDYFRAALLDAVKVRGAQARLSRDSGIGTSYINNIVKGRDSGSEATRRALAAALGFTGRRYEDFLDIGRTIIEGGKGERPASSPAAEEPPAGFFRVPFSDGLRLIFGASGPMPTAREIEESPIMLHGPTLGRNSPWGLRAFGVDDDTMEPVIARGSRILVDLKNNDYRKIKNNDIYVICFDPAEGQCLVRQMEWAGRERDRLALKAANSRYPTLYRSPRDVRILGQVLWCWRKFD